ncbi:membrane protein involved in the export of O-antigen and teichoic acid [Methanolobus tindarius DSM 2278]|uniref:Membrane protein involved in the export of O-antigen and teichoic acid n=1 Tax=Methanolobus tindarius DSM 2278 TaxID=1090322 RepID=W9DQ01_METTI|nr:flippase [Methanolobus tindarius]ETA67443.1 membrane protein involved in the export of O-antigen and teichoic acid [Methanolobus tindarius DSM 2278]
MYFKKIYSRIISVGEVQRQSIALLFGQISYTFLGFLSTMYFAHTLGSSVLGAYFLFLAYYGIINMISDGGFGGAATKRISEGEQQNEYFTAFFLLRLSVVIVVIFSLLVFREYFVDLNEAGLFNWLFLALIISLIYGSLINGIAGTGKMGIYAAGTFVSNTSKFIIQIIAVFLGYGVAGLVGGFIAGFFIASIIEFKFFELHFAKCEWSHVKNLLTFSFWLFLTSSGVVLYSHIDTIMIGYYMSNSDVGIYKVVFQFSTLAIVPTTAIRAALWPKISWWNKNNKIDLIEKSLSKAFTYSLMVSLPIFAGGIIIGKQLLYYFYGSDFKSGYLVLIILLFVQTINVFQFFITMYISALDRQKDSFKVTAIGASANIIVNLALIPIIGIEGAAIATLITMGLNTILAKKVLDSMITIKLNYDNTINIFKASAIMALLIGLYRYFIPISNIWMAVIPVLLGGAIYGILLLRYDRIICEELRGIFEQIRIPWPSWL